MSGEKGEGYMRSGLSSSHYIDLRRYKHMFKRNVSSIRKGKRPLAKLKKERD